MAAFSSVILHCSFLFICLSSIIAVVLGFTVDLIHRDSILSPLHNSTKTHWELLNDALRRSTTRASHFEVLASRAMVQSPVIPAKGEYLMNISLGSPPITMLGIADTGSDLTWTQCKPCVQCYKQRLPIFDPKKSSSFKPIPCGSPRCYTDLATRTCNSNSDCSYYYSYGDQSYTNGVLASETVTFGSHTPSFPEVLVGCGHENGGTFTELGSGIIGLGGGAFSLVTQIKPTIGGKFSYCLVPFFKTDLVGKISFGPEALVSGSGVVSTPLVTKDPSTFYYLTLESIAVGNVNFEYKTSVSSMTKNSKYTEEGNIIIDSGTTLTLLPEEFYQDIEAELRKNIKAESVEDPEGVMSLCYKSDEDMDVPVVKVRFAGAELELKPSNTFVRVQEDMVCFAMIPASEVAIFGNLAQMDFLVGFDLEEGKVSFKAANCSHHIQL
ncbi:aspartic proteinase CDR1-like [Chenopodium quinoa]|uniref:aspartic proteinase CDR1-like n=1 Tax=Chenopodium quinoa TaxID=63459 RepID=UPI000B782FF6|nr:aspartic proteinase CDR1-like [Chenopodium quinoa]